MGLNLSILVDFRQFSISWKLFLTQILTQPLALIEPRTFGL